MTSDGLRLREKHGTGADFEREIWMEETLQYIHYSCNLTRDCPGVTTPVCPLLKDEGGEG